MYKETISSIGKFEASLITAGIIYTLLMHAGSKFEKKSTGAFIGDKISRVL